MTHRDRDEHIKHLFNSKEVRLVQGTFERLGVNRH